MSRNRNKEYPLQMIIPVMHKGRGDLIQVGEKGNGALSFPPQERKSLENEGESEEIGQQFEHFFNNLGGGGSGGGGGGWFAQQKTAIPLPEYWMRPYTLNAIKPGPI